MCANCKGVPGGFSGYPETLAPPKSEKHVIPGIFNTMTRELLNICFKFPWLQSAAILLSYNTDTVAINSTLNYGVLLTSLKML